MAAGLKYAILDTDFVFKVNIIKSETSALADEVLEFPDYQFFCHQKSYGEVKAFVLVQILRLLYGMEAYIFCSDDFGARQGFANGAQIPCISILSVFLKMWLIGKKMEEVQPFFQSFVHWCTNRENP